MRTKYFGKLGISLEDLYAEKKQLRVHFRSSEGEHTFSVLLKGRDGEPDCKVSSFRDNLYFRTTHGQNRKIYCDLQRLKVAIVRVIKNYTSVKGDITFSLSDEIDIL